MLRFTDPVSGYTFTIHTYQWGVVEGKEFVTREYGTTPFGARYREGTPHQWRSLQVRFVGTDVVLDQMRMMTMLVLRHGGPVMVHPDAAITEEFFWVTWPDIKFGRVVENREDIELVLGEVAQPPTASIPNTTYVAQSIIEILMRHDALHLGQAVIEVVVRSDRAYVGQSVVEVMAQGSTGTPIRVGQSVVEVMIAPS